MRDRHALNLIALTLSGEEWTAATLERVADIVRATRRAILEPDEHAELLRDYVGLGFTDEQARELLNKGSIRYE